MRDYRSGGAAAAILRIFVGGLVVLSIVIFVLWRTENARLQSMRLAVVDQIAPMLETVAGPSNAVTRLFDEVQSFSELQAENARLRAELAQIRLWRLRAQRFEEENARLRALNDVALSPRISFVTAETIGDSGGPFAQSAVVNVGRGDGVDDGAPVLDATGLVGRVAGVGASSARIVMLTDPRSRIPVVIGPEKRRAILYGDNTDRPTLQHLGGEGGAASGARVATSGAGAVFPAGLHVGVIEGSEDGLLRVRPAADLQRLDFVRIYRIAGDRPAPPAGGLILRAEPPAETAAAAEPEGAADGAD